MSQQQKILLKYFVAHLTKILILPISDCCLFRWVSVNVFAEAITFIRKLMS